MQDEIRDGKVDQAVAAAQRACLQYDSDGNTGNRARVEQLLKDIKADGNFVVLVDVNNQPDGDVTSWLRKLDDTGPSADRVDVLATNELPGTEVSAWLASANA